MDRKQQKRFAGFSKRGAQRNRVCSYMAQKGETYESAKLFKGHGSGIYEIVSDFSKNAYRAIYVVNIGDAVYVLHAFQKKSKQGIKTPKEEISIIEQRLKQLKTKLQIKR